jgi:hypothetical protein
MLEFAVLFAAALIAKEVLPTTVTIALPNLLWLPILIISVHHGFAAGLLAALVGAALNFDAGLPPPVLSEDLYGYIGRIGTEPVAWTCLALLIGAMRSRQIAHLKQVELDLAEREQQCAAVASLCEDLRKRADTLERRIAADAETSNTDIAQAIIDLHHAGWDDFPQCLSRFVLMMMGGADFSIYLLRDGALHRVFPREDDRADRETSVPSGHALFDAVVNNRRTLSLARAAEAQLLDQRGLLAGPVFEDKARDRVRGMFIVGGTTFDDHPDESERRFSLTLLELSRYTGWIELIDSWDAASSKQANGQDVLAHSTSQTFRTLPARGVEVAPPVTLQ